MARKKPEPYPQAVLAMMAEKSAVLAKAQTFAELGMQETAGPLWVQAAGQEEHLAPLLEGLGHEREAALHRISAASCYRRAGDLTHAVNLYRAALAGPLRETTRKEVALLVKDCLTELMRVPFPRQD